nr:unnamed protein product [Callosobruchus chinensis]
MTTHSSTGTQTDSAPPS